MALDLTLKPNSLYVRAALRRAREAGFVRLGANIAKENMQWLDQLKAALGLSNRDDAINQLIAEHRELKCGQAAGVAREGDSS